MTAQSIIGIDPGLNGGVALPRWNQVREKLLQVKPKLVRSGSVCKRKSRAGTTEWVIRFREREAGRTIQRAVYLGSEAMADAARELIRTWRARAITPEDRRRQELLTLWDLTARCRGYSYRGRQRLRKAAEESFGNPRAELRFTLGLKTDDAALRYGRPSGRPSNAGLW